MSKLFVWCNEETPITEWKSQIDEWTKRYIMFNIEDGDEIVGIDETVNLDSWDAVYIFGSNLGGKIKKFTEKNKNVIIVENLCCDVSVDAHRDAVDFFRLNGYNIVRDYKFLQDEFLEFVCKSLENSSGNRPKFTEDTWFPTMGYDSLDVMNLCIDIEDEYNVYLNKGFFGKLLKMGELYKVLERGQLSNFYKRNK